MKIASKIIIPILAGVFNLFLINNSYAQSEKLINAIHIVESGGRKDNNIIGDFDPKTKVFRAIGPFQIHKNCWIDATEFDKTIGGQYKDCFNYNYSRKIVLAYLKRYGKNLSELEMARVWNGGPSGHKKSATLAYANKVKKNLKY